MDTSLRLATNADRISQYGTVAATLLKEIGDASEQPYLQAVASMLLLMMETVQVRWLPLLLQPPLTLRPMCPDIEGQQRRYAALI